MPRIRVALRQSALRCTSFRFMPCAKRSLRSRSARRQSLSLRERTPTSPTGRGLGLFNLLSRFLGNRLLLLVYLFGFFLFFRRKSFSKFYAIRVQIAFLTFSNQSLDLMYYQVSLMSSTDGRPTARRRTLNRFCARPR